MHAQSRRVLGLDPAGADARYRERFWAKVNIIGPDECWEWTRCKQAKGYGRVKWIGGETKPAHRVAYALARGNPGALLVCHTCDNPPCCNPAHLFLGTVQDNSDDMVAKGRSNRGEANGLAKLDDESVVAIRRLYSAGNKPEVVGQLFGVSHDTVSLIVRRKIWAHVA